MKIIIDCGTTNTKCYLIDGTEIYADGYENFGVKDVAGSKDKSAYKKMLLNICEKVLSGAKKTFSDVEKIIAFGMISAEIGLLEIPHMGTPISLQSIRTGIFKYEKDDIFPAVIPFDIIRGIKNTLVRERALENIYVCDFMRGEETQIFGLLKKYNPPLPLNVFFLSSHTKVIHINKNGEIERSMTTMSGQIYESIVENTIVGKSVEVGENMSESKTAKEICELAENALRSGGFIRAVFLPRFMESFTDLTAKDRNQYLNAVIMLEDMKCFTEYLVDGTYAAENYYFIGQKNRCEQYEKLLNELNPTGKITVLTGKDVIRDFSIVGALEIAQTI